MPGVLFRGVPAKSGLALTAPAFELVIQQPDGHKVYVEAVENAFGMEVEYAMLRKVYGTDTEASRRAIAPRSA